MEECALTANNRLIDVTIDEIGQRAVSPEIQQERRVAVFDLLENNSFTLVDRKDATAPSGPYRLCIAYREERVVFDVADESGARIVEFRLLTNPFRQVMKDYLEICSSYFDAVKTAPVSRIETIDMARRAIHNEGAKVLSERLSGKVDVDEETARRLFTLICALRPGR